MKDYSTYSLWLENSGDDLTPRPALQESIRADVAILGAGFTGLWTAYHLLQREPSLNVVVVEREITASSVRERNGGWCFAGFPYPPAKLAAGSGRDAARAVSLAMYDTVDDVGRVCELEGVDAHSRRVANWRWPGRATTSRCWKSSTNTARSVWRTTTSCWMPNRRWSASVSAGAVGSFWNREGAADVQPARLARGSARAVSGTAEPYRQP